MTKYHHIIWDWNGTLLDDLSLCVDIVNVMLRRRCLSPIDIPSYRRAFEIPVIRFYRNIGFDFDAEPFEKVAAEFVTAYTNQWRRCTLQHAAADTLNTISRLGLSQSILSASWQEIIEEGVRHYAIGDNFIKIVGHDNPYAKGKIEAGRQWMTALNLAPHEVLLIGDTEHDYHVAQAIGADCALLTLGHNPLEKLRACSVPLLNTPAQIPLLLS